ncbi:Cytochrome P450 [Arabidopsis thaliana x Arabidopsis arenosa]|uniref:Cytochrome P450 n=1 Tax=Arabidopsis thaliana x Arabidopsis arenosa TaxID=1240361 RepID=A0A8T1XE18_9BRAS|nr:Cytochrome P450 [Arabidopsis thaliana x Arabidopsis arenosa]
MFIKSRSKRTTTKLNPPPSPWRLPVIGNLHQLSLHPHRSLHSLSLRYGPLMLLHFGRVPTLVVSSADMAHDVMKTNDLKFADRPKRKAVSTFLNGGRDVAFSPYGESWRQFKSICVMHLLSKKMVRSFEKVREEEINVMMEKVEKAASSSSPLNLSGLLSSLTSDLICRIALGRKYSSDGEEVGNTYNVKEIVRKTMELSGSFPLGEYIPSLAWIDTIRGVDDKVEEVSNKIDSFLEKAVQEHVEDHADKERSDFVDILVSIQRDKTMGFEFGNSEIKNLILDVFLGGTATTFTLLEWTMTELMRHPECMKKLKDDIYSASTTTAKLYVSEEEVANMKYLKAVIKEVLRLHPPVPIILRGLCEDVKLKGYDIAEGTLVIINAWAIQRDTETWGADAEEFRPERHLDTLVEFEGQDFMYIPFGSGRRRCPGIRFGLTMAEVTLANLVKRFDWRAKVKPLGHDKPDLAEATGVDVCRKFPLVVFPSCALFSK